MALFVDKMVKFRRQKYEDLSESDGLRSPSVVEFQSVPSAAGGSTPGSGTPNSNTPVVVYQSFPEGMISL